MCSAQVKMHVLVVDDFDDMAETLAALVVEASPMAITTDIGHDGAEALALASKRLPHVAILDLDMPIMSGAEAAIAMKLRFSELAPLLIAMTGRPAHAIDMGTLLAFDVVLSKPVELDRLLDHLTDSRLERIHP
jgi:CheY-like chemotaxis protein